MWLVILHLVLTKVMAYHRLICQLDFNASSALIAFNACLGSTQARTCVYWGTDFTLHMGEARPYHPTIIGYPNRDLCIRAMLVVNTLAGVPMRKWKALDHRAQLPFLVLVRGDQSTAYKDSYHHMRDLFGPSRPPVMRRF